MFFMQFMKTPNYAQIYFPYSTVTSACQGSGLACTQTISIFRTLTYMQKLFKMKIITVNQLQHTYFTNIHLMKPRFMKTLRVITIKLNTVTDVP